MAKRKITSEEDFCPSKIQRKHESSFNQCTKESLSKSKCKIKEIEGDLFDVSAKYSLAHCVAEDMNMSSGIAVEFRHRFGQVGYLLNQRVNTGDVAVLKDRKRFIYYLVTKHFSHEKPTYTTLSSSLKKLRTEVTENKVIKLAMPRIGCGLDKLDWNEVKALLHNIFQNVKIKIKTFSLSTKNIVKFPQRHKNAKITNLTQSIEHVEKRTIIIYPTSENENICNKIEIFIQKFNFSSTFNNSKKILGTVIFNVSEDKNNLLCGCIVKKSKNDLFNFEAFEQCIQQIQKTNSEKFHFDCTVMQGLRDKRDFSLMSKIKNILRNTVDINHKVNIYWSTDQQKDSLRRPETKVDRFKRKTI